MIAQLTHRTYDLNRDDRGWASIHYAFKEGQGEVFSLLIQKGADQSGLDRVEAEFGEDDKVEYVNGSLMDLNSQHPYSKTKPKTRKKRTDGKGSCAIQ
jgi:ankyrin repeat protein